jgi:HEAT repeat protein
VNFGHASRVVEALARKGETDVGRILDLLGKKVEDFETDPMAWLEIFLVELAGEMRLERAIPLVVKKLHECGEVLSEQCVEALGKIGTDAAAEAVAEGWLDTEWDYRVYASSALEKIHSDTTVWKCLELLPQDKDLDIRSKLADALLGQFVGESIEPVREMVQRRAYDPMSSDLMRKLVAVSTALGVTFPEYPIWKREAEERLAKQERRMKEMRGFLQAPPPALPPKPAPAKEPGEFLEQKPVPFLRTKKQVGRNDPCPCGSGKKFKKCCMSRVK